MRIDLSELYPFGEITKTYAVSYDDAAVESYPVSSSPVTDLTVTVHPDHRAEIRCEGRITVMMPCDRCLKEVAQNVDFSVQVTFNTVTGTDEDGEPVFFTDGDALLVNELLKEEILTQLPMKVLCRKDCKGICIRCGADLNLGKCSCEAAEMPTRMGEALMKAFAEAKNI